MSSTRTLPAFLSGLALASLVALFAFKASAKMPDFEVYWRAGARAAAAQPLYRAEDEHYQLKYLPAFAILAIPLAQLPLPAAKAVWFGLSVLLIPIVLALSHALLPAPQRTGMWLATVTLLVLAKFYGHELVLGQVNLVLLFLVLVSVHLLMQGNSLVPGLLLAVAIVVKPYAIIFVPWLVAIGAFAALASAAAAVAAALVVPAAYYGMDGALALHAAWWRTVTESTTPNLLNPDNVSLAAMYAKWLGISSAAGALALLTAVALLGLVGYVVSLRRDMPSPEGLEAGVLLTLMPLLSPQGWDYVFLLATPAVMVLVNYDRELPAPARLLTWAALAIVGLSLYDVMGRRAYGRFMSWSAITMCFLVVIGALAMLRVRRVA